MEAKTFHPTIRKQVILSLISAIFIAGSVFLLYADTDYIFSGLLSLIFGLGTFIIFVMQMLPRLNYLTIDQNGIEFANIGKKKRFEWEKITGISKSAALGTEVVFITTHDPAISSKQAGKYIGIANSLPHTYGRTADELIAIMNAIEVGRGHSQRAPE